MLHTPDTYAIARVAHEAVRAFAAANGEFKSSWEHLDLASQDRIIRGVEALAESPFRTPAENHANWLDDMDEAGWTWGEKHDAELKTHPAFMQFDDLPETFRRRNEIFLAVVKSLLGQEVVL